MDDSRLAHKGGLSKEGNGTGLVSGKPRGEEADHAEALDQGRIGRGGSFICIVHGEEEQTGCVPL